MTECSAYVGLDVHKDTIAVAVALPGREELVYRGEIKNQRKSLHLAALRRRAMHAPDDAGHPLPGLGTGLPAR